MATRTYQRGTPREVRAASSWRSAFTPLTVLLPLGVLAAFFPWQALRQEPAPAPATVSATFHACVAGARTTCVVDGDTIWLQGEKIRIADIEAPELSQPACEAERIAATRATERLTAWLNAGAFEVHPTPDGRDTDRYGNKLRVLERDGASAVDALEAEGVATRRGEARKRWC
ncbi:thermonuclease family protein [Alteriqipengyuania sp. 357]